MAFLLPPPVFHRSICGSCLRVPRITPSFPASIRPGLQNNDRIQRRYKGYIAPPGGQAHSVDGFYADILKGRRSPIQIPPEPEPVPPVPPLPTETPEKIRKEQALERGRLIFGSKQALSERKQEILNASQIIAGIAVPPKPEEPDNCCMSGCVNCVWELYRDEMEEWAEKSAQARAAMAAQRKQGKGMAAGSDSSAHVAISMDDDGGGSQTNWGNDENEKGNKLFDDIPVGIREFMRTEKKLKEMQKRNQDAAQ